MLSCSLFLILLAILIWGPLKNAIDTKWVIPTAMSLIHGNAGDISEYTGGDLRAVRGFGDRVYSRLSDRHAALDYACRHTL